MARRVAVEVEGVWYTYPNGYTALRGVDLVVLEGEALAILGANGSGKTTLVKHFNGLLKPTRGVVRVFGVDTRKATVAELARYVGMVFQNPLHQFFEATVEGEVLFAPRNLGVEVSEEELARILKALGVEHLRGRSPHEASVGEQKRIALASVLIYRPPILVLDEPTVGLDYGAKMRLASMLSELREEGHTIVVVSHDVEFLARIPLDRVVVMSGGRIVAEGAPRDVFYSLDSLHAYRLVPPQIPELVVRLGLQDRLRPLSEDELLVGLEALKRGG